MSQKKKKLYMRIVCILLLVATLLSTVSAAFVAYAATPAIILMDNNKQQYEIGEVINVGVKLPSSVKSFDFTMGYNSACMKIEGEYENNRVHVEGNRFNIKVKITGNGKMYFKVSDISASDGYSYEGASVLRYAGNGKEQEITKSECLLTGLVVYGGELSPEFDRYVDNYWVDMDSTTEMLHVDASPKEVKDTVTYTMNDEIVEDATRIPLQNGVNTLNIEVSTKETSKTYTVFVNRKEAELTATPEPIIIPTEEPSPTVEPTIEPSSELTPTPEPEPGFFDKFSVPIIAVIIAVVVAIVVTTAIVLAQVRQNKKEYDESDEAYRKREERERQKRVEKMQKERNKEVTTTKKKFWK